MSRLVQAVMAKSVRRYGSAWIAVAGRKPVAWISEKAAAWSCSAMATAPNASEAGLRRRGTGWIAVVGRKQPAAWSAKKAAARASATSPDGPEAGSVRRRAGAHLHGCSFLTPIQLMAAARSFVPQFLRHGGVRSQSGAASPSTPPTLTYDFHVSSRESTVRSLISGGEYVGYLIGDAEFPLEQSVPTGFRLIALARNSKALAEQFVNGTVFLGGRGILGTPIRLVELLMRRILADLLEDNHVVGDVDSVIRRLTKEMGTNGCFEYRALVDRFKNLPSIEDAKSTMRRLDITLKFEGIRTTGALNFSESDPVFSGSDSTELVVSLLTQAVDRVFEGKFSMPRLVEKAIQAMWERTVPAHCIELAIQDNLKSGLILLPDDGTCSRTVDLIEELERFQQLPGFFAHHSSAFTFSLEVFKSLQAKALLGPPLVTRSFRKMKAPQGRRYPRGTPSAAFPVPRPLNRTRLQTPNV